MMKYSSTRLRITGRSALLSGTALLAMMVAGTGCGAAPAPKSLQAQIDAVIGDARCSTDAACRTVGVGAKACGGPSAFRAWSTEASDEKKLLALVARQSEARRLEMTRNGELSDCSIVPDSGAFCQRTAAAVTGQCRLRPSGGPAGNSSLR